MAAVKEEPKISAGATRTLNALLSAADDFAFLGAAHLDDMPGIKQRYKRSIHAMRKLINRLETANRGPAK